MKKLFVVASLIFVAACGSKTYYITETTPATTDAKATTTTVARTTAPKPVYTTQPSYGSNYDEDMFVATVYDLFTGVIYLSDWELIDTGRTTCMSLRNGMTGDQLMEALIAASDYDASILELLSAVVASAIVWFCPEQAWKVS